MSEIILKYIEKDPVSYIHIYELLDRNYSIIYESDNGFIIHDDDMDFTYMSFDNKDTMVKELSRKRYDHYIAYEKDIPDFYNDNDSLIILHEFVYPNKKMFNVDESHIKVLSTDYAPFIDGFYKAIGPNESSLYALERKEVLGVFQDDELAGIIGMHPEGCMGMLHIFEKYRRKGYAELLEKTMINKLIKENKKAFCEVIDGNEISMHLQVKLGLIEGKKKLFWLV